MLIAVILVIIYMAYSGSSKYSTMFSTNDVYIHMMTYCEVGSG